MKISELINSYEEEHRRELVCLDINMLIGMLVHYLKQYEDFEDGLLEIKIENKMLKNAYWFIDIEKYPCAEVLYKERNFTSLLVDMDKNPLELEIMSLPREADDMYVKVFNKIYPDGDYEECLEGSDNYDYDYLAQKWIEAKAERINELKVLMFDPAAV